MWTDLNTKRQMFPWQINSKRCMSGFLSIDSDASIIAAAPAPLPACAPSVPA